MRKEICLWLFCLRLWAFWAENCVFCIQSVIGNQTAHFPPGATSHVGWCDASVHAMQKNCQRNSVFSWRKRKTSKENKRGEACKDQRDTWCRWRRFPPRDTTLALTILHWYWSSWYWYWWYWQCCTGTDDTDADSTYDTVNTALVLIILILVLAVLMILTMLAHWVQVER